MSNSQPPRERLRLELRLASPTCISQRPTAVGQLAATLGYLSGTGLRGAIAGLFLAGRSSAELHASDAETFAACFQNPEVRYGNAIPWAERGRTWVLPQTAWSDKRSPGWRSAGNAGVRNVLPTLLRLRRSFDETLAESLDGFDRLGQEFAYENRGRWADISARRRLITRSAITPIATSANAAAGGDAAPSRGVVAAGQLYSLEALEPGQLFAGQIEGPPAVIAELKRLLAPGAGPLTLSVGQGRSRGLGLVQVISALSQPAEERDPAHCLAQAEELSAAAGETDDILLPVTLESDVLLRDDYLLPCASGDPNETLRRYRAGVPPTMSLAAAFQSTRWIGGWDMLRQLPRRPQLAVTQGSVWVYRVPKADAGHAIAWWLDIEREGIGERRGDGYGQVSLLHPLTIAEGLL